jgi:hypothetical protein
MQSALKSISVSFLSYKYLHQLIDIIIIIASYMTKSHENEAFSTNILVTTLYIILVICSLFAVLYRSVSPS